VYLPARVSRLRASNRLLLSALLIGGMLLLRLASPAPAFADGPFSWAIANVDDSNDLVSISCPSASLCVAGETAGNVVTSTDPTGGAGAWTVTKASTSGAAINGVSCPSTSLCVAVDSGGNVVTSTNPTGGAGAWTVTDVTKPGGAILGVSCPSTSLCVVVGKGVVTSTNPTGGAGAWTTSDIVGASFLGAVSCPTASLCVATAGKEVVTSTDPTGGAGAWTVTHVVDPGPGISVGLISVSCPTASFCVAVDYENGVVTSTDPTGGTAAWSVAHIAKTGIFNAVSCASTSLCVIASLIGDVVVGTPATTPIVGPGPGPGPGPRTVPPAAPVVKILSGPPAETADQKATFTFRGVAGGTYECSIDTGAWAPCASGGTFGPLSPGDHLFRVRETLAGVIGPIASYRWTIDLPRACVLRVARARIYLAPKLHKVRLVIHYTSYRPAKVNVSYDLIGSQGPVSLGDISASFATAGVFRDPEILSNKVFGQAQAAKQFKVQFQIAKTPRSCGRYYTKQITIPKKFSGRTVWFQSDSNFAP
jgi:hypothetical protein